MDIYQKIELLFRKRYEDWEGAVQFEGTSKRLRGMIEEMCWLLPRINEGLEKCFEAIFEDPYDEMLVSGPTKVWTLCPHHLVPCLFKVHIGYIPKGKVLGLSKFSRIALILGKRPIMQEQYSRELADTLWENLGPEGVGVSVVGSHGCLEMRGVKQDVKISTAVLKGSFKEDHKVREEFYKIIGGW